jgi:hypothetical protein
MKTFKDIEFKKHSNIHAGFDKQGRIDFENGYGVSVVCGRSAYCGSGTFEVGIMKDGDLTYETDITDDVLGYQSPEDITKIMEKLQSLKG